MNKKLLYILLALVMVCSVALTACNLTPAKVTITYKYNYEGAPADKTVTLDEGATITLDTPTRTDYKFDGWFTDAACTKAFTDKVANANVTLYAKWTASHTHDLHYQSSSSKHWQECSCGYTTEQVDHTFDANNTCVCGYKQGGTAHTHSWATDWSKDATNHWHVCTGCSELNDKAAHDTNGTDGACSVCGYKAQAQGQAVTVYFYTADWTTVNAYAWTDTPSFAEHLGGWPGTAINAVAGEEGWYSVEVPADTQKIIFNDGSNQTNDLLITDGPYFYKNTGYATKEEAEAAMSVPEVKTTLYYYTTAWTTVYAYTWQPESLGAWTGTALTPVEGDAGWFTIDVPSETVNILFNNGDGAQTADLLVADGPYFYANSGYATKEEAEAAISAPVVTTYTLKGSFDNWGAGVAFEAHTDTEVKLLNVALEANAEFKVVISVTGQDDQWINALKDGVTVATVAENTNITVAEAGNYDLYFDITTKQLWIAKVVVEHEHVASETYSSDATGHWYACTTCSAVMEGSFAEHDTEGEEGACSVCGWVTPVEPEKVTLYYYTTTWTAVYAYAWTANEDKPLGEWPGTAINVVSGEEGWYSVEVSVDAQNIIFNNNDGAQTADLLVADGPYFYANSGYATKEEAEAAISAPVVTTYTLKGSFDNWGAGVAFEAHTDTEVKLLNVALEANAEFKVVISVTGQDDQWINALKDGVTVATVAENTNITVAEAGNYDLYFDITTKQLWIAKVVVEHEHVASETYSSDATGHWYACTTCSAVMEGSFAEHDTEGEEGACSVCGWVTPAEPEKVTVYFQNNWLWTDVKAYYWTTEGENSITNAEWPGVAMTFVANDGTYDIYSVEVPANVTGLIITGIKNDGSETLDKTPDITIENKTCVMYYMVWEEENAVAVASYHTETTETVTEPDCTNAGAKKHTCSVCGNVRTEETKALGHTFVEGVCSVCGEAEPTEEEKITVCFQNNWLWTEVKAYYWVGEEDKVFNAEWPGVDMTFVENDGSYDIYSIEVPVNVTGLIISGIKDDGSGVRDQSPDITTGLEDGVLFRMAWNDGNQVEVVCTKHTESESYSSDALNHWLTCVNCTAVLQDTIAAHDTNGENGVCSVCGFDPSQVVETTVLYLTPNANWKIDGARFAAYFFGNGEVWIDMTDEDGDGIYEVVVPEGFVNIIFCRMNPSAAANNWTNKWNQTADLKVPTDGTNMFTVTEGTWDKGGGTWSTLQVAAE